VHGEGKEHVNDGACGAGGRDDGPGPGTREYADARATRRPRRAAQDHTKATQGHTRATRRPHGGEGETKAGVTGKEKRDKKVHGEAQRSLGGRSMNGWGDGRRVRGEPTRTGREPRRTEALTMKARCPAAKFPLVADTTPELVGHG